MDVILTNITSLSLWWQIYRTAHSLLTHITRILVLLPKTFNIPLTLQQYVWRELDDSSQTNSSLEFWIIYLRLGFGIKGSGFLDFGLGLSLGDEYSQIYVWPNSSVRPDFVRKILCEIKLGTRTIVCPNVLFLSSNSQRQHERSVYWVRSKNQKLKNL